MSAAPAFRWQSASRTDVGNVRKLNEDAYLDLPASGLWVVADGMGGHDAGELASRMVVRELSGVPTHERFSDFVDDVEDRVLKVNQQLFSMSHEGAVPRVIGCTFAGVLAFGGHCLSVWAGDSRVYRSRDGKLERITRDHSEVEELVARGEITAAEAELHPSANVITRAVGGVERLFLDLRVDALRDGDRFLICSDGLYKDLEFREIEAQLGEGNCIDACGRLIDTALSRECLDNITVIVVDFSRVESEP
jgi:serine/threonine protein phosphatase PrpC